MKDKILKKKTKLLKKIWIVMKKYKTIFDDISIYIIFLLLMTKYYYIKNLVFLCQIIYQREWGIAS